MIVVGSSEVAGWCWGWLGPSCLRRWGGWGLLLQKRPQQSQGAQGDRTCYFIRGTWYQDSIFGSPNKVWIVFRQKPCLWQGGTQSFSEELVPEKVLQGGFAYFWSFCLSCVQKVTHDQGPPMAWWPCYGMACVFLYRWWCFRLFFLISLWNLIGHV